MSQEPAGSGDRGDRAAFLGRLRRSLAGGRPPNPLRPVAAIDGPPVIAYRADLSDLPSAFTAAAAAVSATVRRHVHDVEPLLAEVCDAEGVKRAVVSGDPECQGVDDVLRRLGVEVVEFSGPAVAETADLGVTGARYGIALTGSLVVTAERAGGRTASLLPPAHLALLRAEHLLGTPGDLFRHLDELLPEGLPSSLNLITGPSRSADIEMRLTLGVHGPKSLWIGLLEQ